MNTEKFLAARHLNDLENKNVMLKENIERLDKTLAILRQSQQMTAAMIAEQRRAVDALPDDSL